MILLIALVLVVGGAFVASRGLGGFGEDGQRTSVVVGCGMVVVGAAIIGVFAFLMRGFGIPGLVF